MNNNEYLDITKININGINHNLRAIGDILKFQNQIFPLHFLLHFDLNLGFDPMDNQQNINLINYNNKKRYLHWSNLTPHGTLLFHYQQFINMIAFLPDIIGKKFIEIGTGIGGGAYIAKRCGFNVVCTNYPISSYNKSCYLLNLNPVEFRMGVDSFSKLLRNDEKADIIYSYGIPFNRDFSRSKTVDPKDEFWIDNLDYLFLTIDDAVSHLAERGIFFSWHNYRFSSMLVKEIANKLMSLYKCKIICQLVKKNQVEITHLTIIKGYNFTLYEKNNQTGLFNYDLNHENELGGL